MSKKDQKAYKKFIGMAVGCFILVLGVSMILSYWEAVVIVFKGLTGMGLAVGGLLVLYSLNKD